VLDVLSQIGSKTRLNIANDVVVAYNGIAFGEHNWLTKLADNNIREGATLTATTKQILLNLIVCRCSVILSPARQ
jgi:hypothetical protein